MTTLNAQVIGQAHYAARAVLERELEQLGLRFEENLVLTAVAGGLTEHDAVVARLKTSLKVGDAVAREAITAVRDRGLLTGDQTVALTESGAELQGRVQIISGGIAGRLYDGLPADDLAVAGRVLTLITERANAELG